MKKLITFYKENSFEIMGVILSVVLFTYFAFMLISMHNCVYGAK